MVMLSWCRGRVSTQRLGRDDDLSRLEGVRSLGRGYAAAMPDFRTLARTLIAGVFVVEGFEAVQRPEPREAAAHVVGVPIARAVGLPTTDPVQLVRLNGAVQVVAGAALALGWLPRVAALVLGASLVPTTLGVHSFWKVDDPVQRSAHRTQFLKNAAVLGGLLTTAVDQGGRPSVFWTTRKAAEAAGERVSDVVERIAG